MVTAPSHDVKLRNKLIFLPLDLMYFKSPDADVLMFAQDNGLTREEFMWFMKTTPAGFQVVVLRAAGVGVLSQCFLLLLPQM